MLRASAGRNLLVKEPRRVSEAEEPMSFLKSRASVAPQGIGKSMPRREDARLLTGRGQYASDFTLPGEACAYIVRSPHPHARILTIDVSRAIGGAGVLAVL